MLSDLNLLPVYDSAVNDLIQDLMIPLLKESVSYARGVGFFTSGWLKLATEGLAALVENGGRARFVLSPILEDADWKAFQTGEEAKCNETLKKVLERQMTDIARELEQNTLNALAWMIADGVLEFKFAIPREEFAGGDYHDKVGVFTDEERHKVAIHGSFNDSVKGSLNGEAFSVFKSWEDGQRPYVDKHLTRLTDLWEAGNRQFRIYTIPEAVREQLIRRRNSDTRPYSLPATSAQADWSGCVQNDLGFSLFPFQQEAVQRWLAADCRGIFEMATGTGKTITSLAAALHCYRTRGRLALIILVPYLHLIDQWEEHCRRIGLLPVLCSSAHGNWVVEVQSKSRDFNLGALDRICFLAVHDTAATEKFSNSLGALDPRVTMIIGDEVHYLGAPALRQAMVPVAGLRVGLSATPRRWFDNEGTQAILAYFGEVCYEFPLEKAIGKYLTPYDYRPELVSLTIAEMDLYEELTAKIAMLARARDEERPQIEEKLKKLLLYRAHIVASAEGKLARLLDLLRDMLKRAESCQTEVSHILIYCAPGQHKEVLSAVAALGLRCHEFVHTVSSKDRKEILDQFACGDLQVLVAIKCLDEGVDVPATHTAFFLASTTNPREFVQRRGRILRMAEGKSKATIYDFVVVPRNEYLPLRREVDASLLKREMPRFAEFSSAALNEFEARAKVLALLNQYELLNLFDEKPWDMYRNLKARDPATLLE